MSNTALAAQPVRVAAPLRPWYLLAAAAAFALMIAAILGPSLWFLNFVHVMTGVLWTGIDLFMGFVIGPILRGVSFVVQPGEALAADAWNKSAFETKTMDETMKALGGTAPAQSKDITFFQTPDIAENGAVLHFPEGDHTSLLAPAIPLKFLEDLSRRGVVFRAGRSLSVRRPTSEKSSATRASRARRGTPAAASA